MSTLKELKNKLQVAVGNESIAEVIDSKLNNACGRQESDDPFYVANLGDIVRKYKLWHKYLPRVEPHYAVKCNDDPAVVSVLSHLGAGFDCASKSEIQRVLGLNVSPKRIVYANPCKQASHLKYAAKNDVSLMTFDNETELHKVKRIFPHAKLVIRILPPEDTKCQCPLGMKYGVHPNKALHLLNKAKELELDVVGVSFHVGSGCYEATAFSAAVVLAHSVFEMGKEAGYNFSLLDIGGGFPGQESAKISFEEICESLAPTLDSYFPAESGVRIIAEPGRFFVASAFTLVVNIISKRTVARDAMLESGTMSADDRELTANDEPMFMYYVNDGVYGSFNCLLYDHAEVTPTLINPKRYRDLPEFTCSIWGPTCDGLDCISKEWQFPELDNGDWMQFADMGAYTICAASNFNGMAKPKPYYIMQEHDWMYLCGQSEKYTAATETKELDPLPDLCRKYQATCAAAAANVVHHAAMTALE